MIIPNEYANWTWPTPGALPHVPITPGCTFYTRQRPPWAVASTESFWGRQLPSMCGYETCRSLLKANASFSYSSSLPPRGTPLLSLQCASSGPSSLLAPRGSPELKPGGSRAKAPECSTTLAQAAPGHTWELRGSKTCHRWRKKTPSPMHTPPCWLPSCLPLRILSDEATRIGPQTLKYFCGILIISEARCYF